MQNDAKGTSGRANRRRGKKRDWGLFLSVCGVLLAALVFVLQADGITMNWQISLLAYASITIGFVWTLLTHAMPNAGKIPKIISMLFASLLLGALGIYGTQHQYFIQHFPPPVRAEDESVLETKKLSKAILSSTSQPTETRLAILNSEQKQIVAESNTSILQGKLIRAESFNLNSLNNEISNEQVKADIQRKQSEIDRQREEIETHTAQQEASKKEKEHMESNIQIFDYAVNKLYLRLSELASESGKSVFTDMPDGSTIRLSNLARNGKIINGTNFMGLGTNTSWGFQIWTATAPPPVVYHLYNPHSWVNYSLTVTSKSANPEGLFIGIGNQDREREVTCEANGFSEKCSPTNYGATIDAALFQFFANLQRQDPLTSHR